MKIERASRRQAEGNKRQERGKIRKEKKRKKERNAEGRIDRLIII